MIYYEIAVKLAPRLSAANKRALEKAGHSAGLKRRGYVDAIADAMLLSNLTGVQHVTITHVNETTMGVWRKGKKS